MQKNRTYRIFENIVMMGMFIILDCVCAPILLASENRMLIAVGSALLVVTLFIFIVHFRAAYQHARGRQ